MRLLLDTHTLLWWWGDDPRLDTSARTRIEDPVNSVFVSIASVWEIAIKTRLGRLRMPLDSVRSLITESGFVTLGIDLPHALGVADLPDHHRDPFDRMLVSQARFEDLTLVTRDPAISRYDVKTVPA